MERENVFKVAIGLRTGESELRAPNPANRDACRKNRRPGWRLKSKMRVNAELGLTTGNNEEPN